VQVVQAVVAQVDLLVLVLQQRLTQEVAVVAVAAQLVILQAATAAQAL
jgi:hypothetical protein